MNKWLIGEVHPVLGEVVAMGYVGESYRWFIKDGIVSMIPLGALQKGESR